MGQTKGVFGLILSFYEDGIALSVDDDRIAFCAPVALSGERERQVRERKAEIAAFLRVAPFQTRVVSYNMQRILKQTADGVAFTNVSIVLEFLGEFAVATFSSALECVVRRHASLRTHLENLDGDTYQTVLASIAPAVEVVDVSAAAAPGELALSMLRDTARTPFNRMKAPLLTARIFVIDQRRHIVGVVADHLIFDGASGGVFLQELCYHYRQLSSECNPHLQPARQYYAFSLAQRIAVKTQWRDRIARRANSLAPYFSVASSHQRQLRSRYTTLSDQFRMGAGKIAALIELSQRFQMNPYILVCAAYALTIATVLGRDAVAIWTVAANRDDPLTQGVIGCCVNPLPIWVALDPEACCMDFVRLIWRAYVAALRDSSLPAYCVGEVFGARTAERFEALEEFGINFNYAAQGPPSLWTNSLRVKSLALNADDPKTWYSRIYLWLTLSDKDIHGTIAYCKETFPGGEHRQFVRYMDELLEGIILRPAQAIRDLRSGCSSAVTVHYTQQVS